MSERHLEVDVSFEEVLEDLMNNLAGSSSGISSDLRNKKLIYQRLILYLKNMNLFEQVCTIQILVVRAFKSKCIFSLISSIDSDPGE